MHENELSNLVIKCALGIHRKLGPGLFESVYEKIMLHELIHNYNLDVVAQKEIPIYWDGLHLDVGFKCDLIVEGLLLVELKSVAELLPVHKKQVLTYLRLSDLRLGLLINFNENLLRDGITRVVNGL